VEYRTEAAYDIMQDHIPLDNQPGIMTGVFESLKSAFGMTSEKVSETMDNTKFEENKKLAENPDNDMGTRAQAGAEAVKNKVSEKAHEKKKRPTRGEC